MLTQAAEPVLSGKSPPHPVLSYNFLRSRVVTRETKAQRRERLKARAKAVNAEAERQYAHFSEGVADAASWKQLSRDCADTWRAHAVAKPGEDFL